MSLDVDLKEFDWVSVYSRLLFSSLKVVQIPVLLLLVLPLKTNGLEVS